MNYRFFIAIPIPTHISTKLNKINKSFQTLGTAKKVPPQNMHITLLFIGNKDKKTTLNQFQKLKEKLKLSWKETKITIYSLGCFPTPTKCRVLWAKIDGDLSWIKKEIDKIFWKDDRFHPHLTITRFKPPQNLEKYINRYEEKIWGDFYIKEIILYNSILKKPHPEYEKIDEILPPTEGLKN